MVERCLINQPNSFSFPTENGRLYTTLVSYVIRNFNQVNNCFIRRRFIWNFLRLENEHLSRLKGAVDHSEEELREYDEDAESEETEE